MIKKKENGITLIALVVTIVVLLILAGVSISMLTGENGVITQAKLAKESTRGGDVQETIDLTISDNKLKETEKKTKEILVNELYNDGKLTEKEVEELQDTDTIEIGIVTVDFSGLNGDEAKETESYIGYYADVDGDGTIDGVIYADLSKSVTGNWYNDYSYTAQSNLKKYTISQESYTGDFGTKPVIKATTTEGNDRFYVMALKDVAADGTNTADQNSVKWSWNYDVSFEKNTEDRNDFGQGKSETYDMIEKWNDEALEDDSSSYEDLFKIFKHTKNEVGTVDATKWFIPSIGEWMAFGGNLGIGEDNYNVFKLSDNYCSVSVIGSNQWPDCIRFKPYQLSTINWLSGVVYLRLSTTF